MRGNNIIAQEMLRHGMKDQCSFLEYFFSERWALTTLKLSRNIIKIHVKNRKYSIVGG
jgi:hypothetical protein